MTTILMATIKKQIQDIESKIASQQGDVEQLKTLLEKLKYQQFEEDIRESDSRQLLKG
jgi:peptidoglycan hydrolase CwlO-like protein